MRPLSGLAACALLFSGVLQAQGPAPSPPPAKEPPAQKDESPAPDMAAVQSPSAHELTRADLEAWLDGYMPISLRSNDIAGAVVVVVKDGETMLQKGYGFSDIEKRTPVDPALTLFRPGSVSKLFTWTSVMQLVEQGKLDLDTDVNTYLDFEIPDRGGKPITLRNIMTHTPGFEEQVKGIMMLEEQGVPALDQHLKDWTPNRIFEPGATPAYSNYATALAGYIVARASGVSFDDYLDKHIFAPLGMRNATFRQPLPKHLEAQMSKGYQLASQPPKPFEVVGPAPAGSLSAAGADMARFMIAHLQNGRFGDTRILSEETAKQMHDTALTVLPRVHRMVLGFYETNINGRRVIAHGGDTQWFHSDLNLFIDDNIGLYISMNSAGKDGATLDVRQTLFEEFADRYLPGNGSAQPAGVDEKTAAEHARLIAGSYDVSRRMDSNFLSLLNLVGQTKVVPNEDGTISVPLATDLAGTPLKWREVEPFLWQQVNGRYWLAAEAKNGDVTRFAIEPYSAIMVFEPTPGYKSGAWLVPVLGGGMIALLLTALAWPIAALARRHYGAPYRLTGIDAKAHWWVRLGAVAVLALWIAWAVIISMGLSDLNVLTSGNDGLFWVLQLLSPIVFFGAAAIGVWNAWVVLRSARKWYAKTWAVLLAIAFLATLWVALVHDLIAFDVNY
jgi:CubicO group peptidase (beta-lactamase class C family)